MTATLLAVPNVSEGRDPGLVRRIAGERLLLDVHSDADHNRSVLTYAGGRDELVDACVAMTGRALEHLDIRAHAGVHPRFGVVDVLPFVPYGLPDHEAQRAADEASARIAQEHGLPVYRYGPDRPLPELRRMLRTDPPPDHSSGGVVCAGVRPPLIAFNVNLAGDPQGAKEVARRMRQHPHVRALAFPLDSRGLVQVSMNLLEPTDVFGEVVEHARSLGLEVVGAEVVGLVPQAAAGIFEGVPLQRPARTIEDALGG